MNIVLSAGFEKALFPFTILMGIAAVLPLIIAILKIKIIPVFVLEIFVGMVVGCLVYFNDLDVFNEELFEGIYTVGLAFLLFLSGLDTDFTVLDKKKTKFPVLKYSILGITLVYIFAFAGSFVFSKHIETNYWTGIILLTIFLASTFASIVIPIIYSKYHLYLTTAGQVVDTYATISELLSIIFLSIYMLFPLEGKELWFLIGAIIFLVLSYLFARFVPNSFFYHIQGDFIHAGVRITTFIVLVMMFFSERAGVALILGAFLAGMILKAAKLSHATTQKLETIGYGFFIPIFFILIGMRIPVYEVFENPSLLLLVFLVLVILLVVKIPLLMLFKWFPATTTLPIFLLSACTLLVSVELHHFEVFSHELTSAMMIASALTCLILPIIFQLSRRFGSAKPKYHGLIIEPEDCK